MSKSYIAAELRRLVSQRSQNCCEYCWISELSVLISHEVDHVIAEKHGGQTVEANLALACASCNKYKGSDIASVDPMSGEIVRLYQPRSDRWEEHFRFQKGEISPLTAIGRVTARLLQFNRAERIAIRNLLEAAGIWQVHQQ
jgi:hypothetical protein